MSGDDPATKSPEAAKPRGVKTNKTMPSVEERDVSSSTVDSRAVELDFAVSEGELGNHVSGRESPMEPADWSTPDTPPRRHNQRPTRRAEPVTEEPSRTIVPAKQAGRSLPHSVEAEEYLLSCCFVDAQDVLTRCIEAKITPGSFYDPKHQIVYETMVDLLNRREVVDIGTVAEELKAKRKLEAIGSYAFLSQVTSRIPTTAQSGYFIEKVREQAVLRKAIRAHTEIIELAYQHSGDIGEFLDAAEQRLANVRDVVSFGPIWNYRSLADFSVPENDGVDALLGKYRFLCRGGALVIAGPTGIGKSSIDIQSSVCWALGRDFLGIPCARPLRSVIFQAEDDDGDIGEIWGSLIAGMKLTSEEVALVRKRVTIVEERAEVGDGFLRKLQRAAAGWKKSAEPFDLVRINPLLSFSGCAVADQQEMGRFLRAGLNRVNADKRWAYIISHHTNKPPADPKGKPKRNWNEYAYEMSGSAEIANWARAVIAIEPLKEEGRFTLRLAKRGKRAGVTRETKPADDFNPATVEVVTTIYARHAKERVQLDHRRSIPMIMWLPDSPPTDDDETEAPKRRGPRPKFTLKDILPALRKVCPGPAQPAPFAHIYRAVCALDSSISKSMFSKLLKAGRDSGRILQHDDKLGWSLP